MIVNIIHLPNDANYPHREQREKSVIEQMENEGAAYRFWDGIICKERKTGINRAHKQIILEAKNNNAEFCCVAEDDLIWYGKGSWDFFQKNMPTNFDLYIGSYYSGCHDENFIVKGFGGLTLYVVANRFFDRFLSLPETMHIDVAISISGAIVKVCDKFVVYQMPGFSEQRRRYADDSKKHIGKPIYDG